MDDRKRLDKVKEYFHKEAADYDEYWKEKPRFDSPMRRFANLFYRDKTFSRLDAILELSGEPKAGKKVLEVGSGGGRYSVVFAQRGADVLGIDFAQGMVDISRKLAESKGLGERCKFEVYNLLDFKAPPIFDVVYAAGVFDYIPPALRLPMLKRMAGLSRGRVIFSYPKKGTLHSIVRKIWLTLKGVPVYYYSRQEAIGLIREAGLTPEDHRDIGTLVVQSCIADSKKV